MTQNEDTLARLSTMVEAMKKAEARVDKAQAELDTATAALRAITDQDIPTLLEDLGFEGLPLAGGAKLVVDDKLSLSVPKDKKKEVLQWLVDIGYGEAARWSVTARFPKNSEERAREIAELLRGNGVAPMVAPDVHSSTLKSIVKARLEAGEDVPLEMLGAHPYSRARIVQPKASDEDV